MKYTRYLINGKFMDLSLLETDNKILKVPSVLVSISVATLGLAILTSVLPAVVALDETRRIKYHAIMHKRRHVNKN